MTAPERCDRTELLVGECAHCKASGGPFWDAKYEGICKAPGCTSPVIDVGERVKWSQDGCNVIHARHKE